MTSCAGDHLGRHLALVGRLVGQHRPPTMSPMAKMCGTLVRICSSTAMNPRSSTLTPAASAPIAPPVGHPPDGDQDLVEHPRADALDLDLEAVLLGLDARHARAQEDIPRSGIRSAWPAAGRDRGRAPVMSWSSISTTVTLAPSASYTQAISRPMIPPPMTSRRPGIEAGDRAPVESMIRGSSGRPGIVAAWDPAAMIALSKLISRSPTVSEWGPREAPLAVHDLDLALLGQAGQTAGELGDDVVLPAHQLRQRRSSARPKEIPCAAISSVSATTRAACSSALEGMQPTFRHTPPSRS